MLEPDAPFNPTINHQRKSNYNVCCYLERPLGKNEQNEIGKFLKDGFAAAKLCDTNKKKVSNHSIRKASVGRLLNRSWDVQPNFVAQLSGHKNLSLDSYYSASLVRQEKCLLSWAVSQVHLSSKCLYSPTNQSQEIFAGAHIDKLEGCTFNINVFCGDRSKIAWENSRP